MAYTKITDINLILKDYVNDLEESIVDKSDEISEKGKDMLRNTTGTYKIRTGKYNKGWKVKKVNGKNFVNRTIYNATNYQLTHLLENGHANRDGSRTKEFVHIAPVEKYCIEKFSEEIENLIKKGK